MFDAVAQVALVVALVLPGFLVVRLSEAVRTGPTGEGALEIVLRGLVYALVIQGSATLLGWLPSVLEEGLDSPNAWQDHLGPLMAYGLVVCVLAPTVIGLVLGALLDRAERAGGLRLHHHALGGRDHRGAWDVLFGRLGEGGWLLIHLRDGERLTTLVAEYGQHSHATRGPGARDLFVERVALIDREDTNR